MVNIKKNKINLFTITIFRHNYCKCFWPLAGSGNKLCTQHWHYHLPSCYGELVNVGSFWCQSTDFFHQNITPRRQTISKYGHHENYDMDFKQSVKLPCLSKLFNSMYINMGLMLAEAEVTFIMQFESVEYSQYPVSCLRNLCLVPVVWYSGEV